ncbi:hypothetical protein CPT_Sitrop_069 [Streptomyces phage Sitrop]|uniref:Uncharacterized protein n=1 Tax=Streptomyces phage Sitrop TaxID=2767587 RepID=A0A873WHW9_9CAUD|nr:hypothetical protein KGG96_gp70 [Streptomyces phage Sitrop]QPB09983.1 hypothetical protein CPT_Sitrop_069 [Streptomyces phage Sitrop]
MSVTLAKTPASIRRSQEQAELNRRIRNNDLTVISDRLGK